LSFEVFRRSCLPYDHAHSVEEAASDFDAPGATFAEQVAHFFNRVRLTYGSRGVVARYAAAVQRESRVGERQVDWVPDQVVDQESVATDAQGFARELHDLVRRQMMHEQFAAHEVEAGVAEGKGQRIADDRAGAVAYVRGRAIENGDVEMNIALREALAADRG
jgi:hypothetical protein